MKQAETVREIKARVSALHDRVEDVLSRRGGPTEAIHHRLLGVEHALAEVLRKPNYVELWLSGAEVEVSNYHNLACKCKVCERVKARAGESV